MAQTILITGASTGFGRLAARALALQGHTVYPGMYMHDGNTKVAEDETAAFATEHQVDLRPVTLNLLSQPSVDAAVQYILSTAPSARLDTVIHMAGHMGYGPAEAFTPEQYLRMYDVNVVGAQRLNQAVLPHFRSRRAGHVIWIGSSSVYGAKSPYLAPYFAAKAAMDSLAQSYARELNPWGIETTILSPGVFTKGTNHFADAAKPAVLEVAKEYDEGPTKDVAEQTMKGTAGVVPEDADPSMVADSIVRVVAAPRGMKPLRATADPADDGGEEVASMVDCSGRNFYRRIGLENLLKVWLN